MTKLNLMKKSFCKRFLNDTAGSMAASWAVAGLTVVFAIGSSYDFSQVSKARSLAQLAADNMALAASIAVDMDNDDKYAEGTEYGYAQIGGPSEDFTGSMIGKVQYDIVDDKDPENANLPAGAKNKLIARATITGTYTPAFMKVMPGVNDITFKAVSDVAYSQRRGTPASIFFVTDNSGSMWDRDINDVRKITSLETSMRDFMDVLEAINYADNEVFRTALFPYNSNLLTSKMQDPIWGELSDAKINAMSASGGTKSTPALSRAGNKFPLENDIHYEANNEAEPLKFLIFMSDGANNGTTTTESCSTEEVMVDASPEYWLDTYRGWNHIYYDELDWFDGWVQYHPATGGGLEEKEVCVDIPYNPNNALSLMECTDMKNDGVQIYSIAYDVAEHEREMAEEFMKQCSSGEDEYYKYASSGADLQQVFAEIGAAVVTEVIRVKR